MELAESLRKIRKQYKLTQEDVAKLVGVSRSGYTYYETGTTVPSVEVLKKLSAVYRTSIDVIVGNETLERMGSTEFLSAAESKTDPLMFMEKDEKSLIMIYRLLDENEKESLRKTVEQILENKKAQNK